MSIHVEADKAPVSAYWTAIVTPLALLIAYFRWRRDAGIAENGIFIEARIEKLGIAMNMMRNVTLNYEVEGRAYSKRLSTSVMNTDGKNPGDTILIIADRRKPKRMFIYEKSNNS